MYSELGGFVGYRKTPRGELQEMRLSIIAEWNVQAEQNEDLKVKQAAQEREMERLRQQR